MVYALTFISIAVALVFIILNFIKLREIDEGNQEMKEIATIIRKGSDKFMTTEYKPIAITVGVIAVLLSLFIEKFAGVTFLIGALMSSAACTIGMKGATLANVRVTNCARTTQNLGRTNQVATRGGSIGGLAVPAFGLLGLIAIYLATGGIDKTAESTGIVPLLTCNPTIFRLTAYSLGCSLVAMFNRVAGGNFTKGADIGSDISSKIRHAWDEDDSRMPSTIADFIGDNVNDIAGNCSDLLESFVATIIASLLIAASISNDNPGMLTATCLYPLAIAGGGLISCIIGIARMFYCTSRPTTQLLNSIKQPTSLRSWL